jgi:2-polyprenyl-3-methyl-5-hydroxy-6-metoxy-1,4-benzoquinol methylase
LLRDPIHGAHPDEFPELAEMEQKWQADLGTSSPQQVLMLLRDDVEEVTVPDPETSWSEYHHDWPLKPCDRWGHKQWAVHRVFKELQPRTVLDLAGNLGWYARLAAVEGAEVICSDIDETCVNRLCRRLRQENARSYRWCWT